MERPDLLPPVRWLDGAAIAAFESGHTDAFRLADGSGACLDWYAGNVLVSCAEEEAARRLLGELPVRQPSLPPPLRAFWRRPVKNPGEEDGPVLLAGEAPQDAVTVSENSMRFRVDFASGYSTGLFCDQRDNRLLVRREAGGRLLNLFAYTCSFSVAGALAGADTVSVDLSAKSLARGAENFRENGCVASEHRFVREDVFAYLPRLARRGERFSWILLDPPTFSRGKSGRVFRADVRFSELLALTLACAESGARILLSTNCRSLSPAALEAVARRECAAAQRNFQILPGRAPVDFSPSNRSSTLWLHLPG